MGAGSSQSTERSTFQYDLVLPCRLSDLCQGGEGFWPVNVAQSPKLNTETWYGHVVGILGQYNKGKTWIMGRLSDCEFEGEGMTIRTEGISFKWIETAEQTACYQHLVADTAGFHTPITLRNVKQPGKPNLSTINLYNRSESLG